MKVYLNHVDGTKAHVATIPKDQMEIFLQTSSDILKVNECQFIGFSKISIQRKSDISLLAVSTHKSLSLNTFKKFSRSKMNLRYKKTVLTS
jgi:hypothetical protein